jgi:hypothetical protein
MYIVIEQILGKQILKVDSAIANTVTSYTLISKYKSLIEVNKEAILFSAYDFKDSLNFVWASHQERDNDEE